MPEVEPEQKVTKSENTRRGSKPLVEKKRRARINRSLNELQNLVLTNKKKEGYKQSRIEKADILEMTVRYLQRVQKQRKEVTPAPVQTQYRDGYLECLSEVTHYLTSVEKVNGRLQDRLRTHLEQTLSRAQSETDRNPSCSHSEDEDSSSDTSTVSSTTTSPSTSPSPVPMSDKYRSMILATRPSRIAPAGPRVPCTETVAGVRVAASHLISGHGGCEIPPNNFLWYVGQPDSSVSRDLPAPYRDQRNLMLGSSVTPSLSPSYLSREGRGGTPDILYKGAMCPSGYQNARDSVFGHMWRPW